MRSIPGQPQNSSRQFSWSRWLLPIVTVAILLALWDFAVRRSGSDLFPKPIEVLRGIIELARKGLLLKYIVASLFRVSWGFGLAVIVGVPLGLTLGWFRPAFYALNPIVQILRPISPIAWIPVAILWFGVADTAPVFLIFLASVFPITVSAMAAVQNMQSVYVRAARNFGLSGFALF
ncbi:MAG TPA: ABC transporter permease subunit, partial [Verrucomicrobiae bacterium]|nr:ABC transporter permease subunit [Verrucomicrobiae bacterium]